MVKMYVVTLKIDFLVHFNYEEIQSIGQCDLI